MRKILPLVLMLLGLGAGVAAGSFLRPIPEDAGKTDAEPEEGEAAVSQDNEPISEFVKLTNQFVVPVVEEGRIASLVIVSLSLEITVGSAEKVYAQEPKLRDQMLQMLFDHANVGGFRGSFTDADNLVTLRAGLREIAKGILGDLVINVLITDIIRQDS